VAKRQQEPIQVRSFVTVNGESVEVASLSPEMRREVATQLKLRFLNAMFRGQAVFSVAEKKEEEL